MPVATADNELTAEMPFATADSELTEEIPFSSTDSELTAEMQLTPSSKESDLPAATQNPEDLELTAELTAELPTDTVAENEDFISDLDDTGVNEELTENMDLSGDETVEMDIEGGTVDTKKIAG